jgi:phosphoenolpyruvate synthase/pyruvate phosphate dikinase
MPSVRAEGDTETGFRDAVLINASYGLGENVVKGFVSTIVCTAIASSAAPACDCKIEKLRPDKLIELSLAENVPVTGSGNGKSVGHFYAFGCEFAKHFA